MVLEFNDDAISEIAKCYSEKNRSQRTEVNFRKYFLKTMFELPDMENVIKVTVDSSSVKGDSEPIVTYGKKPSTSVA